MLVASWLLLASVAHAAPNGQYLILNIASPGTTPAFADEIIAKVGRGTTRRTGFGYPIDAFQYATVDDLAAAIDSVTALSEQKNLPVLLHVDWERWWQSRPDLWNWFDPWAPGFDVANRDNVEWTGWDEPTDHWWLNWGRPIRTKPRPCFESVRLRREIMDRSRTISWRVSRWTKHLAEVGKGYLFAGVDAGWETGIDSLENVAWVPEEDRKHSGYCALSRRGFSEERQPADRESELARAVQDFVEFQAKALTQNQTPISVGKVFSHIWGGESTAMEPHMHAPLWVAGGCYGLPGFSLWPDVYRANEAKYQQVVTGRGWAVSEINWANVSFVGTLLGKPGIRLVSVYNWDKIQADPAKVRLVRAAVGS